MVVFCDTFYQLKEAPGLQLGIKANSTTVSSEIIGSKYNCVLYFQMG